MPSLIEKNGFPISYDELVECVETKRFLPSILEAGLVRGKRHHVHIFKDTETARKVGARRGKPIILQADAGGMYRDGHNFLLSANVVWLTNAVSPGYLKKT